MWNDFALHLFDFQGVPKWGCLILPFSVGEREGNIYRKTCTFFPRNGGMCEDIITSVFLPPHFTCQYHPFKKPTIPLACNLRRLFKGTQTHVKSVQNCSSLLQLFARISQHRKKCRSKQVHFRTHYDAHVKRMEWRRELGNIHKGYL